MGSSRYTVGAATNSKNPVRFADGAPPHITKAHGAWVDWINGERYVDAVNGLGSILLGHGHPFINDQVRHFLEAGVAHPLPHALEEIVAEKLCRQLVWPGAECVRFSKNGA